MNQILSVEMPKSNIKKSNVPHESKKASTKSVILFFSIILLIFGIVIIGIAIFSLTKNKNEEESNTVEPVEQNESITIKAIQNGQALEIEVLGENEITSIEYSWNDGEVNKGTVNGTNNVKVNIEKVPSGTNEIKIIAKDSQGSENSFISTIVGEEPANVRTIIDSSTYKLNIEYQEEKNIKYITYKYNNEEEKRIEVNNGSGSVEIDSKQGENELTIKEIFEDGTTKEATGKIYMPIVNKIELNQDGNAILKASDVRGIDKILVNFNGKQYEKTDINSETFEQTIKSARGENKLIVIVFNKDQGVTVRKARWTNP